MREGDFITQLTRAQYPSWRPEKENTPLTAIDVRHLMFGMAAYVVGIFLAAVSLAFEQLKMKPNMKRFPAERKSMMYDEYY